jgi:hypothetical protein
MAIYVVSGLQPTDVFFEAERLSIEADGKVVSFLNGAGATVGLVSLIPGAAVQRRDAFKESVDWHNALR